MIDCTPLNPYRQMHAGHRGDSQNGLFVVPSGPCNVPLKIMISSGYGWEHVSVSTPNRPPNWKEMEWVRKRTFGEVVAFQFHIPADDHINFHPHCLHMWRPTNAAIPLPPRWMVGPYEGWLEEMVRDMAVYDGMGAA